LLDTENRSMSVNGKDKDYRLEIELLKKDVCSMKHLHEKMENSIDKIDTAANDISNLLFAQEQRTKNQEKIQNHINRDLEDNLNKHIQDSQNRYKELNNKIEIVDDKIEKVNKEVTEKIEQSQSAIVREMLEGREQLRIEIIKINDTFGKKMGDIDAWRYMVMGAIAFVVFIIGNISGIATIFTKLFR
jgi:predicted  nucleic acid-binding Zn-ribbon protein